MTWNWNIRIVKHKASTNNLWRPCANDDEFWMFPVCANCNIYILFRKKHVSDFFVLFCVFFFKSSFCLLLQQVCVYAKGKNLKNNVSSFPKSVVQLPLLASIILIPCVFFVYSFDIGVLLNADRFNNPFVCWENVYKIVNTMYKFLRQKSTFERVVTAHKLLLIKNVILTYIQFAWSRKQVGKHQTDSFSYFFLVSAISRNGW